MSIIAINARHAEEIRVATCDKQQVSDLYIENTSKKPSLKDVYAGVIKSIESSLAAVFVEYGAFRHGFLQFKDISPEYFKNANRYNLKESLKIGQSIMVQVKKEEREDKGATLTTYITLPGTYLVLMPNSPSAGGVSKQITADTRKYMENFVNQLNLPSTMSVILRTAGAGCTVEDLERDLKLLLKQWEEIKKAFTTRRAPFLIFQEGDILARTIRDYVRDTVTEIIVDEPDTFSKIQDYITIIRPDLVNKLHLYQGKMPLFLHLGIEDEVESAFQHAVRLPSGGSILLNRAAAGVMIDVNSGSSTKHGGLSETALRTNLEAATMIARQLRLRDLGGLILIDFIGMKDESHKQKVESKLWESTLGDRARIQIGHILPRFDVLVMSRQRLRSSLGRVNEDTCYTCQGQGIRRSVESLALSIIRAVEKKLFLKTVRQIRIEASIPLTTYLGNEKRTMIHALEQAHQFSLLLLPNPYWEASQYKITSFSNEEVDNCTHSLSVSSYTFLSDTSYERPPVVSSVAEVPAVERFSEESVHKPSTVILGFIKNTFRVITNWLKGLLITKKTVSSNRRPHRPYRIPSSTRAFIKDKKSPRTPLKTVTQKETSKEQNSQDKKTKQLPQKIVTSVSTTHRETTQPSTAVDNKAKEHTVPIDEALRSSSQTRSLLKRPIVHRYGGEPNIQKRGY